MREAVRNRLREADKAYQEGDREECIAILREVDAMLERDRFIIEPFVSEDD